MFSSLIVSFLLLLFFPAHLSLLPLSLSVSACVFVLCWLVFLLVSRCYSLWAVSFSVYCMCLSPSLLLFLCPSCLSTSFYNFSVCHYPSFISVLLSVYLFLFMSLSLVVGVVWLCFSWDLTSYFFLFFFYAPLWFRVFHCLVSACSPTRFTSILSSSFLCVSVFQAVLGYLNVIAARLGSRKLCGAKCSYSQ